jgi:hypothetical protein
LLCEERSLSLDITEVRQNLHSLIRRGNIGSFSMKQSLEQIDTSMIRIGGKNKPAEDQNDNRSRIHKLVDSEMLTGKRSSLTKKRKVERTYTEGE